MLASATSGREGPYQAGWALRLGRSLRPTSTTGRFRKHRGRDVGRRRRSHEDTSAPILGMFCGTQMNRPDLIRQQQAGEASLTPRLRRGRPTVD
ncbi:hypothetical protein DCS_00080 [Drechmeria coniospora]|uniref:Uncharacterized protein n=1 Tax=Drechmeria coniospora TaxID=98403 RepID=A0A151GPD2_DRECN|nr:hypothetical protein DCS_00080 [Drechmeria coniospora]KYK58953.1 hypothetical protein DCS_00080 [Drechmeria coniospora]